MRTPSFTERNLERLERLLGLYVLRILYRNLDDPELPQRETPFVLRHVTEAEAQRACADPELDLRPDFVREVYARGGGCVGALDGERIVGYSWFAYQDMPYLADIMVGVPAHATYRFKAFVRRENRGTGLGARLFLRGSALSRRPGRTHSFAVVAAHNTASLRASRVAGRKPLGLAIVWRLGPIFATWHSRPVRDFGVRLYQAARGTQRADFTRT